MFHTSWTSCGMLHTEAQCVWNLENTTLCSPTTAEAHVEVYIWTRFSTALERTVWTRSYQKVGNCAFKSPSLPNLEKQDGQESFSQDGARRPSDHHSQGEKGKRHAWQLRSSIVNQLARMHLPLLILTTYLRKAFLACFPLSKMITVLFVPMLTPLCCRTWSCWCYPHYYRLIHMAVIMPESTWTTRACRRSFRGRQSKAFDLLKDN